MVKNILYNLPLKIGGSLILLLFLIMNSQHGPGSFLTTTLNNQKFLYKEYNMAVFPDSVDKQTPRIGYLPGDIPWKLSKKLKNPWSKYYQHKI